MCCRTSLIALLHGQLSSAHTPLLLQIAAWAAEIAAFIRSIDPNHMISTGEVGYDIVPGINSSQCMPCQSPDPGPGDALARLSVPTPFSIYHTFINGVLSLTLPLLIEVALLVAQLMLL